MNLLSARPCAAFLLLLLACSTVLPMAVAAADTRIVVDISGSMAKTDPERLLIPSVEALIELLPDGQPASIWTFGSQVNRLMDHEPVTDLWRAQAQIKARALPAVGLRTALPAALEAASWDRAGVRRQRDLILLTDGRLDLGPSAADNAAARDQLLQSLVPELAGAGIRLHALALSDLGDLALLQALTAATGGQFQPVRDLATLPEQLADLMARVRGIDELPRPAAPSLPAPSPGAQAAAGASPAGPKAAEEPTQVLSVTNPPARPSAFRVEPNLAELTLFVEPTQASSGEGTIAQLESPAGDRYDQFRVPPGARWHVAGPREVITLREPQAGEWTLTGGRALRLYSYGELRLALLDQPSRLAPGLVHALTFTLEDQRTGAPVSPALARLIAFGAEVEADEGRATATVERSVDGLLQVMVANLDGVERGELILSATGPTFERELRHRFEVAHPLRVELQPPSQASDGAISESSAGLLWAALNQPGVDSQAMTIAAGIAQPPAARRWYPLRREAAGLWQLVLPSELAGEVELEVDVRAKYLNGGEFSYRTTPLRTVLPVTEARRLSFTDSGQVDAVPAPMPASAPATTPAQTAPRDLLTDSDTGAGAPDSVPADEGAPSAVVIGSTVPEGLETPPDGSEDTPKLPLWFAGAAMTIPLLLLGLLLWRLRQAPVRTLASLPGAAPAVA